MVKESESWFLWNWNRLSSSPVASVGRFTTKSSQLDASLPEPVENPKFWFLFGWFFPCVDLKSAEQKAKHCQILHFSTGSDHYFKLLESCSVQCGRTSAWIVLSLSAWGSDGFSLLVARLTISWKTTNGNLIVEETRIFLLHRRVRMSRGSRSKFRGLTQSSACLTTTGKLNAAGSSTDQLVPPQNAVWSIFYYSTELRKSVFKSC